VVGDGAGRARGGQGKGKKHRSKALGKTVADAELERDMAEGSATMSETERKLAQAAMLRAMFLSFFRVLKAPHSVGKGVLRATLDGGPLCMPRPGFAVVWTVACSCACPRRGRRGNVQGSEAEGAVRGIKIDYQD
jgi:hypothetical protein